MVEHFTINRLSCWWSGHWRMCPWWQRHSGGYITCIHVLLVSWNVISSADWISSFGGYLLNNWGIQAAYTLQSPRFFGFWYPQVQPQKQQLNNPQNPVVSTSCIPQLLPLLPRFEGFQSLTCGLVPSWWRLDRCAPKESVIHNPSYEQVVEPRVTSRISRLCWMLLAFNLYNFRITHFWPSFRDLPSFSTNLSKEPLLQHYNSCNQPWVDHD